MHRKQVTWWKNLSGLHATRTPLRKTQAASISAILPDSLGQSIALQQSRNHIKVVNVYMSQTADRLTDFHF